MFFYISSTQEPPRGRIFIFIRCMEVFTRKGRSEKEKGVSEIWGSVWPGVTGSRCGQRSPLNRPLSLIKYPKLFRQKYTLTKTKLAT